MCIRDSYYHVLGEVAEFVAVGIIPSLRKLSAETLEHIKKIEDFSLAEHAVDQLVSYELDYLATEFKTRLTDEFLRVCLISLCVN